VFLKTHAAALRIAGSAFVEPETSAGALYILRDPRDVLLSFAHHLNKTIDDALENLLLVANRVLQYEDAHAEIVGDWAQHAASWRATDGAPTLLLRYEDMRRDPRAAGRAIFNFLGLPVGDAVVDADYAVTTLDQLRVWAA